MFSKTAALFPGQGSQYPGMNKDLLEQFAFTNQIFEEASDAIHENLKKLCLEGPVEALQLTYNAQPAILTTSYAWYQVLKRNLDFSAAMGAGHSLGEYSAMTAAGSINLPEAATLVRKRGELMQNAVPAGKGKMAALLGLDDDKVKQLCDEASQGDHCLVVPANFNSPGQVVIAGHATAVDRAILMATDGKNPDLKARKAIPLNVSAPFHCPLMTPVAEAFVPFLEAADWQQFSFPVVANLDAKLRWKHSGVEVLRDQIDHPVLWTDCAKTLESEGATAYVEMGPGKVLNGLVKRIVNGGELFALDGYADYQKFEKAYKEAR